MGKKYQAGSSVVINDYRLKSILCFFSKIFEKLAYIHITHFINKQQKHSTHHALITLMDSITKSLDKGNMVARVLLDLSTAFDTVNHKILLKNCMPMEPEARWMSG